MERERKWKLDQTECWSGRTDNSTISRAYLSSLMVAMYLATALVICYTKESLCLHVCRAGWDSCVTSFITQHTLFCRSKLAPPLTNSTTTSVLPYHQAARMSAVFPPCVVTDKVWVQTFSRPGDLFFIFHDKRRTIVHKSHTQRQCETNLSVQY